MQVRRNLNKWARMMSTLAWVFAVIWPTSALAASNLPLASSGLIYISQAQFVALPNRTGSSARMVGTIVYQNQLKHPVIASFNLPPEAAHVAILGSTGTGWRLDSGNHRLYNPHLPVGASEVAYEVTLSLATQSSTFTLNEPYDMRQIQMVVPEGGLFLSAQGGFLPQSTLIQTRTMTLRQFTKLDLQPNTPWSVSMTLLPTAGGRQAASLPGIPLLNAYGKSQVDLEAITNVLLAALILVIGMISIRSTSWRNRSVAPLASIPDEELQARRRVLIDSWTGLETRFSRGELSENVYRASREDLKQELVEIDFALHA